MEQVQVLWARRNREIYCGTMGVYFWRGYTHKRNALLNYGQGEILKYMVAPTMYIFGWGILLREIPG